MLVDNFGYRRIEVDRCKQLVSFCWMCAHQRHFMFRQAGRFPQHTGWNHHATNVVQESCNSKHVLLLPIHSKFASQRDRQHGNTRGAARGVGIVCFDQAAQGVDQGLHGNVSPLQSAHRSGIRPFGLYHPPQPVGKQGQLSLVFFSVVAFTVANRQHQQHVFTFHQRNHETARKIRNTLRMHLELYRRYPGGHASTSQRRPTSQRAPIALASPSTRSACPVVAEKLPISATVLFSGDTARAKASGLPVMSADCSRARRISPGSSSESADCCNSKTAASRCLTQPLPDEFLALLRNIANEHDPTTRLTINIAHRNFNIDGSARLAAML